ncbi:ABC transporter ATP-binding protein [Inquilinus sp. CAU 1745]|uniref:ABC transporter ATP-binding protein n=1 Tax=Inquilinus sp. CAU 1745 TaxID=3140369 RepID=UPI00325C1A37
MTEQARMVEIRDVSKFFEDFAAVDHVNLSLSKGEFLTIVGPSGCGKTTLLRMIAGFSRPSTGEILINGGRVETVPPHRRSIGMVFQRLALFPHMTAAQNVAYPLKMRGFDPATIPERVSRYLKLVRLEGYGGRRPHELSGGQQQRVAIARALSFSPDLLLLDEPLSALDKKLREEMQLEFRRIQQELGVTTINVTHDQREALVMSDKIVVMNEGKVQQSDSPEDVYRAPSNRFVANFIGLTSTFAGIVENGQAGETVVRVGDLILHARPGSGVDCGSLVDCAIRAEQIRFVDDDSGGYENVVTGSVEQRIFEGDRLVYEVRVPELGNATLFVFDHDPVHHTEHQRASRVRLGWNARDLFAFPGDQETNR